MVRVTEFNLLFVFVSKLRPRGGLRFKEKLEKRQDLKIIMLSNAIDALA